MALRFLNSGYFAGSVGIGTDSPSGILSVSDGTYDTLRVNNGTSHLAGTRLYRLDSEVGSSTAWMLDATGNSIIVGPRTGTVQFTVVDASENVKFIVDNGNVGIGVTGPTYGLDVMSSAVNNSARFRNSAGGDTLVRIIAGDYNTEIDARLFIGETDAYGMTFEYDGSANIGYIGMNDNVDPTGAFSKRIQMSRGGTEVAFMAGNVGIGTTSPALQSGGTGLHINATTFSELKFTNNTTGATASDGTALVSSGNNFIINNREAGTITLGTSNSTRMTILSGGNVGIGVTGPVSPLTIKSNSGSSSDSGLTIQANASTSTIVKLGERSNGRARLEMFDFGVAKIAFYTDGNNNYINAGNVGIGTTSPGDKLHVEGGIIIQNGNNLQWGGVYSAAAPTIYGATNYLQFVPTGSSGSGYRQMRLDTTGLGIGTSSPSEKLDVAGNIKITAALLSNQENTDIDSAAAEMVAQVSTTDYTAAFFDFVVKKGTNVRSGTVYACHDGTNVEFTETSTQDLGDTSDVVLSVDKTGNNLRLIATVTSDDWSVKSLIRAI